MPARLTGRALMGAMLYVSLLDLVLLGSGRILQFGPLTLRMALYAAGLGLVLVQSLLRGSFDGEYAKLTLGFIALVLLGSLMGAVTGAERAEIAEDVKPLLFFLNLFFFAAAIDSVDRVRSVASVIRVGASILAVVYLGVIGLMYAGILPFGILYAVASRSDEFFFRGQTGFFYKGFLYLGVGFLFFVFQPRLRDRMMAVALLVAIVFTFTRGLLLSAISIAGLALLVRRRDLLSGAAAVGALLCLSLAAWPVFQHSLADRETADSMRLSDIGTIARETTPVTVVVGRGFGALIGDRPRIEESYFEIFYKQGIPGLVFWLTVLVLLTRDFRAAISRGRGQDALPFFLGALFVFLESATNPFLTNPIGMSMVLVALVSGRVLATSPGVVELPRSGREPRRHTSMSITTLTSPVE
ncbi:MAG: hypothetical protein ACR2M1_10055 [Gemmatimonadaceae bacterium]